MVKNYKYLFIAKEAYEKFPDNLKKNLDQLGLRLKDIFDTKLTDSYSKKECLELVKSFLILARTNSNYLNQKLVASFGTFVVVDELKSRLSEETYNSILELVDSEIYDKTQFSNFLNKKINELDICIKKI